GIFFSKCCDASEWIKLQGVDSLTFEEMMEKGFDRSYYLLSYPTTAKNLNTLLCTVETVTDVAVTVRPFLGSSEACPSIPLMKNQYLKSWCLVDNKEEKLKFYRERTLTVEVIRELVRHPELTKKPSEYYLLVLAGKNFTKYYEYTVFRTGHTSKRLCFSDILLDKTFKLDPVECGVEWYLIRL
ncbi:MAG: hypothetical protein DRQ40_03425, partial [Gammaproteobacteria bacterium]